MKIIDLPQAFYSFFSKPAPAVDKFTESDVNKIKIYKKVRSWKIMEDRLSKN